MTIYRPIASCLLVFYLVTTITPIIFIVDPSQLNQETDLVVLTFLSSAFGITDISMESSKSITPGAEAFPYFPQLPTELRLKIWNFNFPRTRLVPIKCGSDSLSCSDPSQGSLSWTSGCTSIAPIPVNLHVCAESRAEALKHYTLNFGFARGPGQVFFNPECDILYFGPRDGYMAADSQFHTYMSMCDPAEIASVRRIAINDALFWIDNTYRSMTASRLTVELLRSIRSRMPQLQEIIFVPREDVPMEGYGSEYVDPSMVHVRMARQIQTALATLCEQTPHWKPPQWRIVPLSAFPSPYA